MAETANGLLPEPNQDAGEGNAPKTIFTEEQTAALSELINKTIGQRTRSHKSDLEEIKSTLKALQTPKSDEPKAKAGDDPRYAELRQEMERLTAKNTRAREANLRSSVKQALMEAGFNAETIDPLIALHVDSRKTVRYRDEDSDEIVWSKGDDTFSLSYGINDWVKTDPSTKHFLSPKGIGGSGDSGNYSGKAPKSELDGWRNFFDKK